MSSHRLSLAQERPPPLPSPSCSRLMWSWRLHKLWCWLLPESSPNRWEPLLVQVCYSALLYSFCLFLWGKCSRLFQKESGKHFSFISMPPVTVSVGCVCQWHNLISVRGRENKGHIHPSQLSTVRKDCFMVWAQILVKSLKMFCVILQWLVSSGGFSDPVKVKWIWSFSYCKNVFVFRFRRWCWLLETTWGHPAMPALVAPMSVMTFRSFRLTCPK